MVDGAAPFINQVRARGLRRRVHRRGREDEGKVIPRNIRGPTALPLHDAPLQPPKLYIGNISALGGSALLLSFNLRISIYSGHPFQFESGRAV